MRKACESGSSAKKAPSENEAEEGQEKKREGGTGKLRSLLRREMNGGSVCLCRRTCRSTRTRTRSTSTTTHHAALNVTGEKVASCDELELLLDGILDPSANDDADDEDYVDPVQIFESDDAYSLNCQPPLDPRHDDEARTILGISETLPAGSDAPVHLEVVEPCLGAATNAGLIGVIHPAREWVRKDAPLPAKSNEVNNAHVLKVLDLTRMQDERRRGGGEADHIYTLDSPGSVLHLLRSLMQLNVGDCPPSGDAAARLHTASPWYDVLPNQAHQLFGILLRNPTINQLDRWSQLERDEIDELLRFRVGDAAPSRFLHSASQLSFGGNFAQILQTAQRSEGNAERKDAMLVIYRHHSPRELLAKPRFDLHNRNPIGCLEEAYVEAKSESETNSELEDIVSHRFVSPPYQSHSQEYPGLLDELVRNIASVREEASRIPQWTAWPERNHYGDEQSGSDPTAPASWTVFPLCYTFPANDLSRRKFVDKTCSFVPETTRLLKSLGPALRTALFSRLDPRTRLNTHTGWSDLANHVLRVHIPLAVPGGDYSAGLAGTWVDGCVETHEAGRIVCFDDSKVHRAYNYSDEERVVLIVDLLRPSTLPPGHAVGGHTDALDEFIRSVG